MGGQLAEVPQSERHARLLRAVREPPRQDFEVVYLCYDQAQPDSPLPQVCEDPGFPEELKPYVDSGDPVLALEALDLLAPIHGRAVGMPFADQAVHEALELFGQVLEDDAVRLHGLQVPRRHGGQCIPDAADRDVLRGHHEVVHGPTAPVGQQLGHVDVVPVHPARGVQEQLPVLAAGAVELVVAGAHGVD